MSAPGPTAVGPWNVLHQHSGPHTAWTTVNAAENIPGLVTPLGFDFWLDSVDLGVRGAFQRIGVLPASQVRIGASPDERFGGVFFGHFAGNVDQFRRLADMTPGTSGDAFERNIFGSSRQYVPIARNRLRYPLVAARLPFVLAQLPRLVHSSTAEFRTWWQAFTAAPVGARPAAERLHEAHRRMVAALVVQTLTSFLAPALFDKLGDLARSAGRPDLHLRLSAGYGDLEELTMISALHRIAHRPDEPGNTVEEFLAVYGARCDGENEISAKSWREQPERVHALVQAYRRAPDRTDPLESRAIRAGDREAAEAELLTALPAVRRGPARLLMRMAHRYIPLREEGKHLMAMSIDGGRCAARERGRELAATGQIDDAEDVFLLNLREILDGPPENAHALIEERRRLRAGYADFGLPQYWVGDPDPVLTSPGSRADETAGPSEITGIAGAFGVAEGIARVVADAEGSDDLQDGEILVCRTTDPSWAAAFHLINAVVIDIGGTNSHAAIVSRELGLPCVINTQHGTRAIQTGDHVRVDGTAGLVTILDRSAHTR